MRIVLLITLLLSSTCLGDDWQLFRGPGNRGVSQETNLPLRWSKTSNIRWSTPLPGPGNGSPIVTNGLVFLAGGSEDGRRRSLSCYSADDGSQVWVRTVEFDRVEETHQTNPFGATTPASDGERVVVWHGSAGMICYDLEGKLLWSRDLGMFDHVWGYGSSPIIHQGKVIQLCGPGERQFLAALDLETGEILWETPEPGGNPQAKGRYVGSWSTPLIVEVNGKEQILCGLPTRVAAYDPETGNIVWYVEGVSSERSDLMYTTPHVSGDFAVAMGGFGGPALGFTLGGEGNMTEINRKWHVHGRPRNPQRIGSGMIVGDAIYMANADNEGSIECRDLHTGELRWEVRRSNAGPHWASMLFADGRLYATGQHGVTTVFAPDPTQYRELARNDLGERVNATPAISGGHIYIRSFEHLYCIGNQTGSADTSTRP